MAGFVEFSLAIFSECECVCEMARRASFLAHTLAQTSTHQRTIKYFSLCMLFFVCYQNGKFRMENKWKFYLLARLVGSKESNGIFSVAQHKCVLLAQKYRYILNGFWASFWNVRIFHVHHTISNNLTCQFSHFSMLWYKTGPVNALQPSQVRGWLISSCKHQHLRQSLIIILISFSRLCLGLVDVLDKRNVLFSV